MKYETAAATVVLVLLYVGLAVLVCGCGAPFRWTPPVAPPVEVATTTGELIASCGKWAIIVGSFSALAGGISYALAPAFSGLRAICGEALVGGLVALFGGACLVELGNHTWIMYLVGGVVLAVYAYRHQKTLLGFAKRFQKSKV